MLTHKHVFIMARWLALAVLLALVLSLMAACNQGGGTGGGAATGNATQSGTPAPATVYTYDDAGRLVQVVYPDSTTITYTYDQAGHLLKKEITHSP